MCPRVCELENARLSKRGQREEAVNARNPEKWRGPSGALPPLLEDVLLGEWPASCRFFRSVSIGGHRLTPDAVSWSCHPPLSASGGPCDVMLPGTAGVASVADLSWSLVSGALWA